MHTKTILAQHQLSCVAAAATASVGQFCYPTGTGKTIAEAHIIAEDIKRNGNAGVYVVLAPRIMLAAQLFEELWKEIVIKHGINCNFFSLHSGRAADVSKMALKLYKKGVLTDLQDQDDAADVAQVGRYLREAGVETDSENFGSGTSINNLLEAYERSQELGHPLIICSTYHSADHLRNEKLLDAGFNISVMIADEGHNAVATGFTHIHTLPADKRFYFTATRKFTDGELGMNNEAIDKFGPLLDALSPREAVARGLILRPRLHFITTEALVSVEMTIDADTKAIIGGFIQHSKVCGGLGAKLLVAARGTQHIREVREHSNSFEQLRATRPNLHVFEITSAHGALINGVGVKREEFLARLQGLKDADEAIIMHYDILSEGIDVPGITGVMPLRGLGMSKFLQTLGRATRLHLHDREKLAAGKMTADELDWFTKKYAWIVLPNYGEYGGEITSTALDTYIPQLRDYGFIPSEDIVISEAQGESEPETIDELNKPGLTKPRCAEYVEAIYHKLEDAEAAQAAYNKIKDLPVGELLELM